MASPVRLTNVLVARVHSPRRDAGCCRGAVRCAAHADRGRSLSIGENAGGDVDVRCAAGCNAAGGVTAV
jgi:hypothetical protein